MILYNAPSSYYSMIGRYALCEAEIPFENKRMDIHFSKDQLTSWYMALNPQMTVPILVDNTTVLTSSQDILTYAAQQAGHQWMDSNEELSLTIQQLVHAHYNITIERLTFSKALCNTPWLGFIVRHMLRRCIKKLEAELTTTTNKTALEAKIELNQQRLRFFTEGNLKQKLALEKNSVLDYLAKLPQPQQFLFGDKISSVDIVTVVLIARLQMIGEYDLIKSPELITWFEHMQQRANYKKADIWTGFQPWRLILKR